MSKLRQFLFLLLLLLTPALQAEDVVLLINFEDQVAFTSTGTKETLAYLKSQFPQHRVEALTVRTQRSGHVTRWGENRARMQIQEQFTKLNLQPEDRIRLMLIGTHGSSNSHQTHLTALGNIKNAEVDDRLQEFFEPMRPYISQDLRLILESCNTFCGTTEQAAVRARALLTHLSANNGSIYGATTSHIEIRETSKLTPRQTTEFTYTGLTISAVVVATLSQVQPEALNQLGIFTTLLGVTGFTAGSVLTGRIGQYFHHWAYLRKANKLKINYGRLFQFKEGQVDKVTELSFTKEKQKILGNSKACATATSSSGN